MHPYSRASIASALNSRTLSLHGALGRSKSSRENLLMHAHAALLRWLISCVSSPSSLTRPPKYRNWAVWAYFCPAASMTSGGGDPPFFGCFSGARVKRVSVFFSDTVQCNICRAIRYINTGKIPSRAECASLTRSPWGALILLSYSCQAFLNCSPLFPTFPTVT